MAYQGNAPATVYTSTTKDTFSGDGSTTAFTLSRAATQNAIRVVVANVVQDPGVAYTCSGSTLTFTSAPPSGTNNIYVVHLGPPAATVVPPSTINNATTFTNGVTLKNETAEDTDGGRESTVTFTGTQSGGEVTTLAEIEASHDGTADDEKGDLIFRTNDGSDGSAPTERLRIDSAGNLLVNTTASQSGLARAAIEFDSGSQYGLEIKDAGSGTTGTFGIFYRGTTAVGSIGVASSDNFYIGGTASSHGGILFNDTGGSQPAIQPCSVAGTLADASVNLGSSGNRFENLYLSGGVYVGGTTSSNHLDDYEQGSFTPAIFGTTTGGTGTYSIQRGGYIKIGELVYAQVYIGWTAHTGTGGMRLSGLPFTSENTNPHGYGAPNMSYASGLSFNYNQLGGYVAGASTTVVFNTFESANLTQVSMDGSVAELLFNLHYIAQ